MGNCSHKLNFWAMKIRMVPKCSEEHSPVRGQWSGVRGQGSGVKTGVKYQDLGFLELFLDYMCHRGHIFAAGGRHGCLWAFSITFPAEDWEDGHTNKGSRFDDNRINKRSVLML